MNFYPMTDDAILLELGSRIAAHRLRKNITQEAIANAIGVTRITCINLEKGKGNLKTVVAALRYLDALDSLDSFLPPLQFSPIEARRAKGKVKQRASTKPHNETTNEQADW